MTKCWLYCRIFVWSLVAIRARRAGRNRDVMYATGNALEAIARLCPMLPYESGAHLARAGAAMAERDGFPRMARRWTAAAALPPDEWERRMATIREVDTAAQYIKQRGTK